MFIQVSPNGKHVYVSLAGSGAVGKYFFDQDILIMEKKSTDRQISSIPGTYP